MNKLALALVCQIPVELRQSLPTVMCASRSRELAGCWTSNHYCCGQTRQRFNPWRRRDLTHVRLFRSLWVRHDMGMTEEC
jgi:hypothetical protein